MLTVPFLAGILGDMVRTICFALLLVSLVAPLSAADVTGNWNFSTSTPDGEFITAILKLKVRGSASKGR
jgi:hypothetical protein